MGPAIGGQFRRTSGSPGVTAVLPREPPADTRTARGGGADPRVHRAGRIAIPKTNSPSAGTGPLATRFGTYEIVARWFPWWSTKSGRHDVPKTPTPGWPRAFVWALGRKVVS